MPTTLTGPSPAAPTTRRQLDELESLLQRMLDLPVAPADESATSPAHRTPGDAGSRAAPAAVKLRPVPPAADASPKPAEPTPEQISPLQVSSVENPRPRRSVLVPSVQADELVKLAASWQPSANTWAPLAETLRRTAEQSQQAEPTPELTEAPYSGFHFPASLRPTERGAAPPVAEQPAAPAVVPEWEAPQPPAAEPPFEVPTRPEPKVATVSTPPPPPMPAPEVREDSAVPQPPAPLVLQPLIAFNWLFDVALYLVWPARDWLRGPLGRNVLGMIGGLSLLAAVAWYGRDWFGWTR
jgi:hypothetical protein